MHANPLVVVLDACVLAPMPVADTLLRLAEGPCLFVPKWSLQILEELRRTLAKFGFNSRQVERRIRTMTEVFPESLVQGFESTIPAMTNDPKDRHVVAAAVKCGARMIVSDNQRHFPAASLKPHQLECVTADRFLADQYGRSTDAFCCVLREQAADIRWSLPQLIARHVPSLARLTHNGADLY
jgi:hypothetical protein